MNKSTYIIITYVVAILIGIWLGYGIFHSDKLTQIPPNTSSIDSTLVDTLQQKINYLSIQVDHYKDKPPVTIFIEKTLPGINTNTTVTTEVQVYPIMDSTFTDTLKYRNLITSDKDTLDFDIFYYNNIKTYLALDGNGIIITQNPSHQLKNLNLKKNNVYKQEIDKKDFLNLYGNISTEINSVDNRKIKPLIGIDAIMKEKYMIGGSLGVDKYIIRLGMKIF